MNYLTIDTATEQGLVAVYQDEKVLGEIQLPFGFKHSKELLPKIDQLFSKLPLTPDELDFIAAGCGPGSYTGVRVGVVVGKMLAYSLKIPLVGVSSLCAYTPEEEGEFATLFDARIGGVYMIRGVKKQEGIEFNSPPEILPLEQVEGKVKGTKFILSPHTDTLQKKLSIAMDQCKPNSSVFAQQALQEYHKNPHADPFQIKILYLRKTQAEIQHEK